MRRPRSTLVIGALVAGALATSCAAILGFERLSTEDGFVFDSGADAPEEAAIQIDAGPEGGPCRELGLPAMPDAAPASGPAVIVALKLIDFGVDDDGGGAIGVIPGFNLDLQCSVDLATSTCKTNVLEPTFDRHARDKTATGVDNAGFSLIQYINGLSNLLNSASLNDGIAQGKYGATMRITGWNGAAQDSDVQVELFPAIGLLPRADPDAGFNADDLWVLDNRFQVAPTTPASTVKSDQGWVSDGKLVARFKEVYLPILIDRDPKPFDLHLTDAVIVATLETTDAGTTIAAGTVSGRWKTADFLGQVRTIFVKNGSGLQNATLCDPDALPQRIYHVVKDEICAARDIRGDSNDNGQLGCDAISAAMRVEGYPVNDIGVYDAGPTIPPRCVADGSIPSGDDCDAN